DIRSRLGEARDKLLAELTALGAYVGDLKDESLNLVIQRADQEQRMRMEVAQEKARVEGELSDATKLAAKRERDLADAEKALEEWRGSWTAALDELGLAESTAAEAVGAQLDII